MVVTLEAMRAAIALTVVAAALALARQAAALGACSAADISAQEPACPLSGPCTIVKQYTVADGCTLDFSGRDVMLAPSAVLTIGSGTMILVSNDLILAAAPSSGAYINGRGTGSSAPTNQGGAVVIHASGNVVLQKNGDARARIEVSGTSQAGYIEIDAGGIVTIAGRLKADQELHASLAGGGYIDITSAHDIVSLPGSQVLAGGGSLSRTRGGTIEMDADGKIDLGAPLNVSGSYGGQVDLTARGDVIVRGIVANGTASNGDGGYVEIDAGNNVRILDSPIQIDGSDDQNEGGCGGGARIDSVDGDLTIAASISGDGRGFGGAGGDLSINSGRALLLSPGAMVSVHGYGTDAAECDSGELNLRAVTTMTLAGKIDASSQVGDAQVGIEAGGNMTISGTVTVT
ncbi:MAG: hypothetical protein HY270_07120 [Deltaproteobacteria bacterium]|nr:hypothetical protein [Deltaproteobacteria bacterium]